MEGESIPQSTEIVSWAVRRWLETKEAPWALHGTCGSFLLFSCRDRPVGDMLLQSKHRTHSGRKQCSGGRKESENLPSNLTSRV